MKFWMKNGLIKHDNVILNFKNQIFFVGKVLMQFTLKYPIWCYPFFIYRNPNMAYFRVHISIFNFMIGRVSLIQKFIMSLLFF
jgi:hypothetical protein